MRELINIIDTLNEVTMSNYGPGQQFLISGSKTGQKFKQILAAQGLDTDSIITMTGTHVNDGPVFQLGKGNTAYSFQNEEGQIWSVQGSESGISGPFVHYKGGAGEEGKIANRGEIAEGILGAAMFSKFTKRESQEEIGQVTPQDIAAILDQLKQTSKDMYQVAVRDANNQYADTITFLLRLKTGPYRDLMDPAKRELLANEYASAAAYVNSLMAERYSKYFYLNGKADDIAVMADGAASETEKKTDVWVGVRGKDGKIRQLRLNSSLKIGGVKQFGQVGGSSIESMQKLWSYFDIDVTGYLDLYSKKLKKDQFEAIGFLYKNITKTLAAQLAGDSESSEYQFVDKLAHVITHFATLGDPNVELVDFDKGGFKILRFRNLAAKLKTVDLTATYLLGKATPEIAIHDRANPKNILVSIRSKRETKKSGEIYVRNLIEKGRLLEELTKVTQPTVAKSPEPKPPVSKPTVKAAPAPVAAQSATPTPQAAQSVQPVPAPATIQPVAPVATRTPESRSTVGTPRARRS